jgi:hypothetical protein
MRTVPHEVSRSTGHAAQASHPASRNVVSSEGFNPLRYRAGAATRAYLKHKLTTAQRGRKVATKQTTEAARRIGTEVIDAQVLASFAPSRELFVSRPPRRVNFAAKPAKQQWELLVFGFGYVRRARRGLHGVNNLVRKTSFY